MKQTYDPVQDEVKAELLDREHQFEMALEQFKQSIKLAFGGKTNDNVTKES